MPIYHNGREWLQVTMKVPVSVNQGAPKKVEIVFRVDNHKKRKKILLKRRKWLFTEKLLKKSGLLK